MMNGKFKEFEVKLDVDYDNCQFIIERILENFDAKIDKNICDIQTIYCDLIIEDKFKICIHYHDMVGLTIIALTKESEEIAKKISDFIDHNFSISPKL